MNGKPENIQDCNDAKYILERMSFNTDKDIVPGDVVIMTAEFLPLEDGEMKEFTMSVYKKIKLWS